MIVIVAKNLIATDGDAVLIDNLSVSYTPCSDGAADTVNTRSDKFVHKVVYPVFIPIEPVV